MPAGRWVMGLMVCKSWSLGAAAEALRSLLLVLRPLSPADVQAMCSAATVDERLKIIWNDPAMACPLSPSLLDGPVWPVPLFGQQDG